MSDLLEVHGLRKTFAGRERNAAGRRVRIVAVDDVDLRLRAGETLGLVGESGSGKSTVARCLLRLVEADAGTVLFDGQDLATLGRGPLRRMRRRIQMVFQDPYGSLDPLQHVRDIVGEPLEVHEGLRGAARDERVAGLLERVRMGDPSYLRRYPYEFSGGQRQRIAIARALASRPALIVCDEPVSALDVATQSEVVNLLRDLQEQEGIAYLFISHDLSVVRHISDHIAVMYLGRIVEQGPAEQVCARPLHPYTAALLAAVPIPDPRLQRARERIVLRGDVPSAGRLPSGCRFHPRCPYAMDVCREVDPALTARGGGRLAACHLEDGPVPEAAP